MQYLEEKLNINVEGVENIFVEHYLNRDVILHKFYLENPTTHYIGADIWGLIYDILVKTL